MEFWVFLMLGAIFCGRAGIISEIRKVERQSTERTQTFKNIDESLSKIEKHFEQVSEKSKIN
ncbi:hypothetical protein J4G08_00480 [Candidatus Poribacteria bacterium]|nr:hypothetical protein [Candidatus Poribacteria bacterium]